MNEILERIAKSLESIDAELKARNEDRKTLINQAEQIEKTCLEIKEDPFGLNVLKEKALSDKANLERSKHEENKKTQRIL